MKQTRVIRRKSRVESSDTECRSMEAIKTRRDHSTVDVLVHEIDVVLRSRR